jgi:hypothetical protein
MNYLDKSSSFGYRRVDERVQSPVTVLLREEGFSRLPRRADDERPVTVKAEIADVADVRRLDLSPGSFRTPLARSSWDSETKIEVDQWFRGIRVAAYCLQIRDQLSRSVTPSRSNARC